MSAPSPDILDLYDLALLLNYERASAEPRFRYAKLREVASASSPFKTVVIPAPEWTDRTAPKDGFIFDKIPSQKVNERYLPDLPSNMLVTPIRNPSVRSLTPKQIETIYWQARGHDGCFKCIVLLQHFFDLYPEGVRIRVRTSSGAEFTTLASSRCILEMVLLGPKLMTMSCILPSQIYITGDEDTMVHAVMGFTDSSSSASDIILDMASLQFGDAGRGLGGRSTFVLESRSDFGNRLNRIANSASFTKTSARIRPCPDDGWLKPIAAKVKARWENRHAESWCGHCGSPGPDLKKCSKCRDTSYCDAAPQVAAWPFHKKFCAGMKDA
ncbi:hypothetical protein B0H17DRAFT_958247 [Mycena rosella]|uniref:MYND-type domain-containing protein n=1 Tax=Mycena rosella TaxID=1033263 RepID=A0AAD7G031_MYCRO|nr:hypothetical protein B0H17DRAFT_958247 [Mycena rosella]